MRRMFRRRWRPQDLISMRLLARRTIPIVPVATLLARPPIGTLLATLPIATLTSVPVLEVGPLST
jgi:hypothetical protein